VHGVQGWGAEFNALTLLEGIGARGLVGLGEVDLAPLLWFERAELLRERVADQVV